MRSIATIVLPLLLAHLPAGAADEVGIRILADRPGPAVPPTLFGIFFEDINLGADGGLYAEMVKNRGFEFPEPLMGWRVIGEAGAVKVLDTDPYRAATPRHVRISVPFASAAAGLANEGFRGMGVRAGEAYVFSAAVRKIEGVAPRMGIELKDGEGKVVASARLDGFTGDWTRRAITLRPSATEARAHLEVLVEGPGALDLDFISLFPERTWKGRPGGFRSDVVQLLADLKPGFLRFPGGCIVEGRRLDLRYRWKETIGPVEDRKVLINRWNDEFRHRPTPDYFQSFGLGFFEFFQLCEDIGAAPLPILNCGMACQFNSGELVPVGELGPYIQDALDLVEFASGPASSPWGRRRAEMGHPEPFGLKFLGIGNEQWGPEYIERYVPFAKALKAAHPEVLLIAAAGPSPGDDRFHFLWGKLRALGADIVDEHCYDRPDWFFRSARRFDGYDRVGPKVFMGEYAAQSVKTVSPDNRSTWECALSEAAFMTGLERNCDVVLMSSYAPLSAHADGWQWKPNLLWFDNLQVFGTASYFVQQAFARNRGDRLLSFEVGGPPALEADPRLHVTASRDDGRGEAILKVVNARPGALRAEVRVAGAPAPDGTAKLLRIAAPLDAENSFEAPVAVAPVDGEVPVKDGKVLLDLPPASLTVLRIPLK